VAPPSSPEVLKDLPVERLVDGLRQADAAASSPYAAEIIRRFEPLLRRAWRQWGSPTDYRDFVQEVFLRLFSGLPGLRDARAFPGYLRKVILSVAASHLRHRGRSADRKTDPLPEPDALVDRFDERLLAAIFVRSYLEELPPREREVARLTYIEERSAEDVAAELELSAGAVRSTKSRATRRLREILLREAEDLERSLDKG
jgi:RNA polymerase sigma factor (sigma-70 family)